MPSRDGTTKLGSLFPGKKFRDLTVMEKRLWYKTFYGKKTPEKRMEASRKYKAKLFNEFMDHYGHTCTCCGESDKRFLSIEHLQGGGNKHRKTNKRGASVEALVKDIRDSGWPPIYTTLCFNCNFAKWRMRGVCPHVIEKAKVWLNEILEIQREIDAQPASK